MKNRKAFEAVAAAVVLTGALSTPALATTQPVFFNVLNATSTLTTPFASGDTLRLDTLVTQEFGALDKSITFTVAAGVTEFFGRAAWEISTPQGPGPRLVGVNIDLLDASDSVVASDTFEGVIGGFAVSSIAGAITPGVYTMRATGNGVRESSLDATISLVPEPQTNALMLAGLGIVALCSRRRA
jgi:hypothetical protein